MKISFEKTPLSDLFIVNRNKFTDHRGHFSRIFCSEEFLELGFKDPIKQINYSHTKQAGTIRGMHFQNKPFQEIKIVSCIKGKVFDVAVDMRRDSATYLQWHAEILSEDNNKSLFIPKGFAHGFQSLTENSELVYLHSEKYSKEFEVGINAFDGKINIKWPVEVTDISTKDQSLPFLE